MNYLENLVQFALVTLAKMNHQENLVRCCFGPVQISRYIFDMPPSSCYILLATGDMHRDVVDTSSIPLKRPLQWGLNTIWAVDDFTQENGATRFVARL